MCLRHGKTGDLGSVQCSLWRLSPRHQGWGFCQGAAPQPPSSFFGNTILLSNQPCPSQNYNPPASAPFHVSVIASCTVFLSEMDQRNQPWLIWKTEERTCYTSYHVGSPDKVVLLISAHLVSVRSFTRVTDSPSSYSQRNTAFQRAGRWSQRQF